MMETLDAHSVPKGYAKGKPLMEKYCLKPSAREILVNNGTTEGSVDVFSYAPDGQGTQDLGHLFVIGHTSEASDSVSYMVSLIAALARREYYRIPGTDAKESFTRAIRKVNEVVDEFFRNSGVSISAGIFAVAGGRLLVSRLDKFKILVARDENVIDVLSDATAFSKDHIQEHKFTSVISGPVHAGDRLLAYWPAKGIAPRERGLKKVLLEGTPEQFAEHCERLGKEKASFACAMIHVAVEHVREQTVTPEPILPRTAETPAVALASAPDTTLQAPSVPEQTPEPEEPQEVPHIIASEFSLGTRTSRIHGMLDALRGIRLNMRTKLAFLSVATLIIAGGAFVIKATFLTTPEEIRRKEVLSAADAALDDAQKDIEQNNVAQARKLLFASLGSLQTLGSDDSAATNRAQRILGALDTIDRAQDAQLTQLGALPEDSGAPRAIAAATTGASIFALTSGQAGTRLWRIEGTTVEPLGIIASGQQPIVAAGTVAAVAQSAPAGVVLWGTNGPTRVPTSAVRGMTVYEGNAYVVTATGIAKISDIEKLPTSASSWLASDQQLPENVRDIAVDGSVFLLSPDGTVTKLYKGKQTGSLATTLALQDSARILVRSDEPVFYIADFATSRIYVLDKETGAIAKALKLPNERAYVDISTAPAGTFVLLASDGTIWSLK